MNMSENGLINSFESIEEALETLYYWKRALGIANWRISLSIERGRNMDDYAQEGNCRAIPALDYADIALLHPADKSDERYDMEEVLVHELLHVRFRLHARQKGSKQVQEERTIERLAITLVRLRRGLDPILDDTVTLAGCPTFFPENGPDHADSE